MAKVTKKTEDTAENAEQEKTAAQPQETARKKSAAEEERETTPMVYVGPPVKGTILHSTFIVFAEGIPEEYRTHPTFKHLFVPPGRLDQARKEIGKAGSLRNTYYKRAVEETNEKGGK